MNDQSNTDFRVEAIVEDNEARKKPHIPNMPPDKEALYIQVGALMEEMLKGGGWKALVVSAEEEIGRIIDSGGDISFLRGIRWILTHPYSIIKIRDQILKRKKQIEPSTD